MTEQPGNFILWTGGKHSGKTTAAESLLRRARAEGFSVAGVLGPAVHDGGRLIGFDAVDVRTSRRAALARLAGDAPADVGQFRFLPEGLALGSEALSPPSTHDADLVIVDEFGPLELQGRGFREAVDSLIASAPGVILVVVREELTQDVRGVYPAAEIAAIPAGGDDAVETVIRILKAGIKNR